MATDTVFVDGTLATGSNNGTSWENAYQGVVGLQSAIDAVTKTNTTNMYIRNTFTLSGTNIDIDGTSGGTLTTNDWLSIIGCHPTADTGTDATPLTLGNYVQIDANGSLGDGVIKVDGTDNVRLKNIHVLDNGDSYGILFDNATFKYNYELNNVKSSGHNSYALFITDSNTRRILVKDCVFDDCDGAYLVYDESLYSPTYINCVFKSTVSQILLRHDYGMTIVNCIFNGGDTGLYAAGNDNAVKNCTFYGQTVSCVEVVVAAILLNNIFMPALSASDYGVLITSGSVIYSDYNCTWAVDGAACQMSTAANGDNDIAVNPAFTAAGSDNFEVGSWQLMESGMPDTGSKPSHIGAIGLPSAYDIIVGELL